MTHNVGDRLRRGLGVSAALLAMGSSFSYGTEQSALNLSVIDSGQGKRAVVSGQYSGPGVETLSEKLIIAKRGCFYSTANNAAPTLLIFPNGTTITSNGRPSIELDGDHYPVGARMTFSGDTITLSDDQLAQAAPCVPQGKVFQVTGIGR